MWPFKKKKGTAGYTFCQGGKIAVVIFTKPDDSGLECYFFDTKKIAKTCKTGFARFAPGLRTAGVMKCTLEEVREKAGQCGASVRRIGLGENLLKELGG